MNTDGTQINTEEASSKTMNPYAAPQTVTKNSPKPSADCYYLRASFWAAAVVGWFVAGFVLSLFATIAGSSQLVGYQSIALGVSIHVLAALIGFEHARRRGY